MVWLNVDVDVDIYDAWEAIPEWQKADFLKYIDGEHLEVPLSKMINEVKYLHLHDDKTSLEVLEELERRL